MYDLVSLGEVMLRLSPPKNQRLRQATSLEVCVCGAQFNMAANLAQLGRKAAFVTRLPDNELGALARGACLAYGVDMSHVQTVPDARMGVVYVEFAADPRPIHHLYDRQGSAASTIGPADFNWRGILEGARLAYTDGIFLALSESCREATLEFIRITRAVKAKLCFDMNYREAIWGVQQAQAGYRRVLPCVDVLVTNRSVSEMLFDAGGDDEDLLWRYRREFGCATVCLTTRRMNGQNGVWKSMALHESQIYYGEEVEFGVVDLFGTGDAFFSGFLHGYLEGNIEFALNFGNALCALAHTIEGDVAQVSAAEVMRVLEQGCERPGWHVKR